MNNYTRRKWLKQMAASAVALSSGQLLMSNICAKENANIIIIGGGYGGVTCAHYIKKYAPNTNITLIEPNTKFISCPFSNLVITGIKNIDFITHQYSRLTDKYPITLIHDWVVKIKKSKNTIVLRNNIALTYDFLILSPGVDFIWKKISGYNEESSKIIPHAWKAGEQTLLLNKQLTSMKNGGTVLISIPEKPYRAPPAPYERASLMASYLKKNNPRSKILLIDPNGPSEKSDLFKSAWDKHYSGMIELLDEKSDLITELDIKNKIVISQSGTKHKADVINIIPPQFSASITRKSGLANKLGWCNINPQTFQSQNADNIYIIGDATDAGAVPKLAHAANAQAKACAVAIVSRLSGVNISNPVLTTSVYSFISSKSAISEVGIFNIDKNTFKKSSGGISKKNASKRHRLKESKFAYGWYKGITRDMFGS